MENSSQFDLEAAIRNWRTQLRSSSISGENLLELELHLRDSIASLRAAGHPEEDSFALASYRLGQTDQLATEFAKTHREGVWFERILWMLLGAQLFSFTTYLANIVRGLLLLPQTVLESSGSLQADSFRIAKYLLWISQYLIAAGMIVLALKALQKRAPVWDGINALRRDPRKWCGALVGLSFSLGFLSLLSSLLPLFVSGVRGSGPHTHFDFGNLLLMVITSCINAVLLPGITFWFLRRQSRAANGGGFA
jgi:hypothetical protein